MKSRQYFSKYFGLRFLIPFLSLLLCNSILLAHQNDPLLFIGVDKKAVEALELKGSDETHKINDIKKKNIKWKSYWQGKEQTNISFLDKKNTENEGTNYTINKEIEVGTLISNYNLNPNNKLEELTISQKEKAAVLDALKISLSKNSQTNSKTFINAIQNDKTDSLKLKLIEDRSKKTQYAIATLVAQNLNNKDNQSTLLAILIKKNQNIWQKLYLETNEGCIACEAQATEYEMLNFGDLFQKGSLDLVFLALSYESSNYKIISLDGEKIVKNQN